MRLLAKLDNTNEICIICKKRKGNNQVLMRSIGRVYYIAYLCDECYEKLNNPSNDKSK